MMMLKLGDVVSVDLVLFVELLSVECKFGFDVMFVEWMEESCVLLMFVVVLCVVFFVLCFVQKGFVFDIDMVNFVFFVVGILLYWMLMVYVCVVVGVVCGVFGIMIQFLFYVGIQVLMDYLGFVGVIMKWFVDIVNVYMFLLFVFLSLVVINFVVLLGGGYWVVQGLFVMLVVWVFGVDFGKVVMVIVYGEVWINMVQLFWVLFVLVIVGFGVCDIMGYCVMILLFLGVVFVVGMYLF